jgi:hypothetical protein
VDSFTGGCPLTEGEPGSITACAELGGSERAEGGDTACERDGVVADGRIGDLVLVEIVNADTASAAGLTPLFGEILAAAGSR